MMKYKGTYLTLFSLMLKKYLKEQYGSEVLPVCCEIDYLLTEASHGVLHRDYTLATGGDICDYWIVPDKIQNPQ